MAEIGHNLIPDFGPLDAAAQPHSGKAFVDPAGKAASAAADPQMKSRGLYELMRRQAQELKQQREPEPHKTHWAPGSLEYQAEQEEKTKAQIEADAGEGATLLTT